MTPAGFQEYQYRAKLMEAYEKLYEASLSVLGHYKSMKSPERAMVFLIEALTQVERIKRGMKPSETNGEPS